MTEQPGLSTAPWYLIDSHTHLDAEAFDADRHQVLARAAAARVQTLVTIGSGAGLTSARAAVALAQEHTAVFCSVGVHPNDASIAFDMTTLEELAKHPRVVAIGETGLDFYWEHAQAADQERWFRAQIALARSVKKPLVIHSRNSGSACFQILQEERAWEIGGVFHCFSEDSRFAARLADINFIISVPGNITFKKAEQFRQAVRDTGLDRLMLETDAPYLAPVPHRGKRCESAWLVDTAQFVAALKGVSLEELARATSATAERLFHLPPPRTGTAN